MTNFDEAIAFAVKAHSGMYRKRESTPYILHPFEVATIVGTITSDEEVLAAAILHDTVEDTDATIEQIREQFGERVALLVASETEDKRPEMPPEESWKIRKSESLQMLRNAEDPGVRILWLADKLSNMRSFYRGWRIIGNKIWESFHQKDPAQQAWYYRTIDELTDELRNTSVWQEYHHYVSTIFEGIE